MGAKDTHYLLFVMLLAVCLAAGCGGGTTGPVSPQDSSIGVDQPLPATGGNTWPATLPVDALQPWEELDSRGRVVTSINLDSEFQTGYQRYLESSGGVSEKGDALQLDSGTAGLRQLSWAIYRVLLGGEQPGVVATDINLLPMGGGTASTYYLGLSNYAAGSWEWHGPFTDNHVRISTGQEVTAGADYLTEYGNTFICIATFDGAKADVVAIGANPVDTTDTTAPAAPTGLTGLGVVAGVELQWNASLESDLAGYRVYYSTASFTAPTDPGVHRADYLAGSPDFLVTGITGVNYFRVAALDITGNESPLSEEAGGIPQTGTTPVITLTANTPSAILNESVSLIAGGGDGYNWDLDGDGAFDITNDTSGVQTADTGAAGIIRPRVRGYSGTESCVALGAVSLIITTNARPAATGSASPTSGVAPLEVSFTGAESTDFDGTLVGGGWDFQGDGVYDVWSDTELTYVSSANYTYTSGGVYNAKLRVIDDEGAWDVFTVTVVVDPEPDPENVPPVASLVADPTSGDTPLTVTLNGDASSDTDGTIVEWAFDFDGDGFYDAFSDTQSSVQHVYTEIGAFSVGLRVTDDDGAQGTTTTTVTVIDPANPAPTAGLVLDCAYCDEGTEVELDASGSTDDGSIVLYEWDFEGDGTWESYGTSATVNHTYPANGLFAPRVRVTDDGGSQDIESGELRVNAVFSPAHPWASYGGNPWNTRRSPYVGPQTNNRAWSFTTDNIIWNGVAVAADGTVYAASYDQHLYALNPDGTEKWNYALGSPMRTAPALGPGGTVYVGLLNHRLYAINPDGTLRWYYLTGGDIYSSPVVDDAGTVYFANQDHKLYAIAADGTLLWTYDAGGEALTPPAIDRDGTVYFSAGTTLYAIENDGSLKWTETLTAPGTPVLDAGGRVLVADGSAVYALDADGNQEWDYDCFNAIVSPLALGADGMVYYGTLDSKLRAVDQDGSEIWDYTAGEEITTAPAIGADGTIYFGSNDDKVYALNPDGTLLWSYTTGGDVVAAPVIGPGGILYVGSYDHSVYAFGEYTGNAYPTADLEADRTTAWSPFLVNFDASLSTDSDGELVWFEWDFDGDGNYEEEGTAGTTGYNYAQRGWYRATVRVTDNQGATDTAELYITLPSEWSGFGGHMMNNSPSPYTGPGSNGVDWTNSTPTLSLRGQAVFDPAGNLIYASDDDNVYCLANDNTAVWNYTAPDRVSGVALADNGTTYTACVNGYLYALNMVGTELWSYDLGANWLCPTVGPDGAIYGGTTTGNVRVINPDGTLKWSASIGAPIFHPIALDEDGVAYIGTSSGPTALTAYNPDGTEKWQYAASYGLYRCKPLVTSDRVYFGSTYGRIHSVIRDTGVGEGGSWPVLVSATYPIDSSLVLDDAGNLIFGCDDGYIYKYYPNGNAHMGNWPYATGGEVNCTPVIGADGTIYCGSNDGFVYALDSYANLSWSYDTGAAVVFLVMDHHGALYAGGDDGELVRIIGS